MSVACDSACAFASDRACATPDPATVPVSAPGLAVAGEGRLCVFRLKFDSDNQDGCEQPNPPLCLIFPSVPFAATHSVSGVEGPYILTKIMCTVLIFVSPYLYRGFQALVCIWLEFVCVRK